MLNLALLVVDAVDPFQMYVALQKYIDGLDVGEIPQSRQKELTRLAEMINASNTKQLNFICTHNSRRSQFAQAWSQTMAKYLNKDVSCYSGGIEVTACNTRTIRALKLAGFKIELNGLENPVYKVLFDENEPEVILFSKLYSDNKNPSRYIAVMTCDHADQNCPVIPEATARYSLTYTDPKRYDDSVNESVEYAKTSKQIATEMKFLFSKLA